MIKNGLMRKTVESPSLEDFKNRSDQQLLGVMQVQLIPVVFKTIPWGLLSSCFCITWLSDCHESYEYDMAVYNRKMDQVANLTGKASLLTVVELNRENHSHNESKSNLTHSWQMNMQTLLQINLNVTSLMEVWKSLFLTVSKSLLKVESWWEG